MYVQLGWPNVQAAVLHYILQLFSPAREACRAFRANSGTFQSIRSREARQIFRGVKRLTVRPRRAQCALRLGSEGVRSGGTLLYVELR